MPREIFGPDHPFLPRSLILSYEEIARLAAIFIRLGTQKIRLTGGEPLLRKDLPHLVSQLAKQHPKTDLALTTNGILLHQEAPRLHQAGLRRVTVSLDALNPDTFRKMSDSHSDPATVLKGIHTAAALGFRPVKINTVVKKSVNEDQILPIALRFNHSNFHVRFIEYMDVGNSNGWRLDDVVSAQRILEILEPLGLTQVPAAYPGEVATHYRTPAGAVIGVISSVTHPFCRACTRARLTSDGRLFTCLFGSHSTDLRTPLRSGCSDDAIAEIIATAWNTRSDRYSEQRSLADPNQPKPEMSVLGG
jgi:cyclic pyranopterin phosphate synthase